MPTYIDDLPDPSPMFKDIVKRYQADIVYTNEYTVIWLELNSIEHTTIALEFGEYIHSVHRDYALDCFGGAVKCASVT